MQIGWFWHTIYKRAHTHTMRILYRSAARGRAVERVLGRRREHWWQTERPTANHIGPIDSIKCQRHQLGYRSSGLTLIRPITHEVLRITAHAENNSKDSTVCCTVQHKLTVVYQLRQSTVQNTVAKISRPHLPCWCSKLPTEHNMHNCRF